MIFYLRQLKIRLFQHCSELLYVTHYQWVAVAGKFFGTVGTTHNFALF